MSLVARGGAKSRWIYLVLLFLLGWGGFHNFYRGRLIRGFIEFTLGPGLVLATPFVAGGIAWLVVRGVWTQDDGLAFSKLLYAAAPCALGLLLSMDLFASTDVHGRKMEWN